MRKPFQKRGFILAGMVTLTLVPGLISNAYGRSSLTSGSAIHRRTAKALEAPVLQNDQPLRVLFIGNSLTYYNNLPHLLEQLAASSDVPRKLQTRLIGFGGATLHNHWERGEALKAIREGTWDYVVLQEQSSLGAVYMVNGKRWITPDPEFFHQYARLFDEEIKHSGAKTVFFLTWARKNGPPREQAALTYAYMKIAGELNANVAPVGVAWQEARTGESEISLYLEDGSHPSSSGTYLAACVFYSLFYGKSRVGLRARITGNPIDDRGMIDLKKTAVLVDLAEADASRLQRIAWQTQKKLTAAGGYFETPRSPPPKLPTLPEGRKPAVSDLEGLWKGWIKLYEQPGKMELRLSRSGKVWKAEAKISFGGKRDDIVPTITSFEVSDTVTFFADSRGSNGASVKYQAAFRGKSLSGIAEIIRKDRSSYAIGTWELKRRAYGEETRTTSTAPPREEGGEIGPAEEGQPNAEYRQDEQRGAPAGDLEVGEQSTAQEAESYEGCGISQRCIPDREAGIRDIQAGGWNWAGFASAFDYKRAHLADFELPSRPPPIAPAKRDSDQIQSF